MDAYATPTNDTDYSFHIKAIEFTQRSILHCITPLVINSLGGRHTHIHKHAYTNIHRQRNFKKPDCGWCAPGLKMIYPYFVQYHINHVCYTVCKLDAVRTGIANDFEYIFLFYIHILLQLKLVSIATYTCAYLLISNLCAYLWFRFLFL